MAAKTINDLDAIAFADIVPGSDLAALWDASGTVTKKSILYELIMAGLVVPAAGAGAGTSYRWKGQDAGSGNSAGGGIVLEPGLKAGSGADGSVVVRRPGAAAGVAETQFIQSSTKLTAKFYPAASGGDPMMEWADSGGNVRLSLSAASLELGPNVTFVAPAVGNMSVFKGQMYVQNGVKLSFDPSSGEGAALSSAVSGVIRVETGWLQNTAGLSRVANAVTNATDTMAAITGLSATLIAGRKYAGEITLFCSTDQAAEGAKFDFDGGSATMTSFAAAVTSNVQGATLGTTVSAALGTDLTATALNGTGVNCLKIAFAFVCNAAGTFIPRLSQVAHASGTLTVAANSFMKLDDMP